MTENFTGEITPYYFLVKTSGAGVDINPDEVNRLMLSAHNPFINSTIITYILPVTANTGDIELKIYDSSGRTVKELVKKAYSPGQHTVTWNGEGDNGKLLPSGSYFLKLRAGDLTVINKVIRLR